MEDWKWFALNPTWHRQYVWSNPFANFSDLAASAMPDDRAIMTYVSSYYHTFAGAQKVWN